MDPIRSLTTSAVAGALRLSPGAVAGYARRGAIPCDVTPGGHRRYNLDEVRAALGQAKAKPLRRSQLVQQVRRVRAALNAYVLWQQAYIIEARPAADAEFERWGWLMEAQRELAALVEAERRGAGEERWAEFASRFARHL